MGSLKCPRKGQNYRFGVLKQEQLRIDNREGSCSISTAFETIYLVRIMLYSADSSMLSYCRMKDNYGR
jgi:hypothetical protein